ncbi:formyl transferase, partial [Vararia minispora EC-137]
FRVLFFGLDQFSCKVFDRLRANPDIWESITVATKADRYTGRHRDPSSSAPLKTLASTLDFPILTIPESSKDFHSWTLPAPFGTVTSPPDPANILITASFGRILPGRILSHFAPTRCLNVHPSSLPAYRGPAPIQRVIMNGEIETAVSIIEMTEYIPKAKRAVLGKDDGGIDGGDIWAMERAPIPANATFPSLRDALAQMGGDLLVSVLRGMLTGVLTCGAPQTPPSPATPRANKILTSDAFIDFTSLSAAEIIRRHRAISHQEPLVAFLSSKLRVQFHEPSVRDMPSPPFAPSSGWLDKKTGCLLVVCHDGSVLAVPKLKSDSRALLMAKEWWNGAPRTIDEETGQILVRFVKPS